MSSKARAAVVAAAASIAGICSGSGGARALAADQTDISAGQRLAQQWCAECHQIAGRSVTRLDQMAPAFDAVTNQPSTTELSLRAFFRSPHPNMPDIRLTREQIDDLVAYILSLKRQ
jgi:mono/diheme cytochrome c family protein